MTARGKPFKIQLIYISKGAVSERRRFCFCKDAALRSGVFAQRKEPLYETSREDRRRADGGGRICGGSSGCGIRYDGPVIGITWKSNTQDYAAFKKIIEDAGGVPVELGQVKNEKIGYNADGTVAADDVYPSGMLTEEAAAVKANRFDEINAAEVMKQVDGVFFTGGEDISPSLFKVPQKEENKGEAINAARDISDYTLMSYCIAKDIPVLAVCRGEQMMGIVSGVTFIQDIPTYYADKGADYNDLHRMPAGVPNRTYAHHDVEIFPIPSHLYQTVGDTKLEKVSSWHHQAVESLTGTPLVQTAQTVSNGVAIVEGVENPYKKFCVGVQFHPENDLVEVGQRGKDASGFCDNTI